MTVVYIAAALFACFVCFVAGFNLGCRFTERGYRAQADWLAKVRRENNIVPLVSRSNRDNIG
jgi:hypothetical protein